VYDEGTVAYLPWERNATLERDRERERAVLTILRERELSVLLIQGRS
jgi:hypothetical protein